MTMVSPAKCLPVKIWNSQADHRIFDLTKAPDEQTNSLALRSKVKPDHFNLKICQRIKSANRRLAITITLANLQPSVPVSTRLN
jgi:hypothetical protein